MLTSLTCGGLQHVLSKSVLCAAFFLFRYWNNTAASAVQTHHYLVHLTDFLHFLLASKDPGLGPGFYESQKLLEHW